MTVYVGPTPLYDLGQVGEVDLLAAFDGDLAIPDAVAAEVTAEPAATNVERFCEEHAVETGPLDTDYAERARSVLDETDHFADVRVVEGVLDATAADEPVGVVADDRRLRAVCEGLGATVTGTFGVVVRAAAEDKYLTKTQAKRIVRRLDSHGLHTTGELRERAVGVDE